MKITDRSPNAGKLLEELKIGDVFRDEDGDILMKINPYCLSESTNCVNLKNGEGYSYPNDEKVIPIADVELIIG